MASNTKLQKGISVVICCYNSAGKLPITLEHLAAQQIPEGLPWEIVLVNNACNDDTSAVAIKCWQQCGVPAPLHIIEEHRPGTDHARRAGVYAAQYSVVLFCDDDNWLASDYMATAFFFLESHLEVGLVGGQAKAVADEPLPDWFLDASPYYAACAPRTSSMNLTEFGIWSAGMMGRTLLLRFAMPENIPLLNAGRIGNNTGFGEDGEICMRIALQGFQIWYLDKLNMQHWMDPGRLSIAYRDKLLAGATVPAEVMASYFRMLHYKQIHFSWRWAFVIFQAFKLLSPSNKVNKFAIDYCFYGTGLKRWETEINSRVNTYYRAIRSGQIFN